MCPPPAFSELIAVMLTNTSFYYATGTDIWSLSMVDGSVNWDATYHMVLSGSGIGQEIFLAEMSSGDILFTYPNSEQEATSSIDGEGSLNYIILDKTVGQKKSSGEVILITSSNFNEPSSAMYTQMIMDSEDNGCE